MLETVWDRLVLRVISADVFEAVVGRPVRFIGDLNPGWARTQTALAARGWTVRTGSSWTNIIVRSRGGPSCTAVNCH
jgi:hypothetical protein